MPVRIAISMAFSMCIGYLCSCSDRPVKPQGFEIEKGFQLTLTASEPLIRDPVDMQFNEHGDAMVLEMPGYPFEDKQSRILILKDTNSDGTFDKSIVYAEGLQLGTSFLPYKKGVLVAAPPYLLHLRDTDGDLKADVSDTLMGGFATENLQHNYNGLTYGIDNWIYAVNGGNSGKPYWWGDTLSMIDLQGQDLRLDPVSRRMERIGESSGGYGLGMDNFGRLFETHNLTHISHLVFQDRYVKGTRLLTEHTLTNISDHDENGLARIYPIGEQESRVNHPEQSGYFSGSCGITFYGGGAFGKEYDNSVWVADVVLNLIHVDRISPKGASFSAERMQQKKEFMASSDRSFRPVKMCVGPQGEMYVIDMHRKVIEHPEWIPDEIEKTLDLKDGTDKGRIYRITRDGADKAFDPGIFGTTEGRVRALTNSNQWVRKTAQRLLMEDPADDNSVRLLESILRSDGTYGKLHAMRLLATQKKLKKNDLLKLLDDGAAGIQENALQVAEEFLQDREVADKVTDKLKDPDARVRMQSALTMSTFPDEWRTLHQERLMEVLTAAAALKNDDWNISAITLAAGATAPELFAQLARQHDTAHARLLSALALASAGTTRDMSKVLEALTSWDIRNDIRTAVVRQLVKAGFGKIQGNELLAPIRSLEIKADPPLLSELASLRKKLALPPSPDFIRYSRLAIEKIADRSLPDSIRLQQMSLVDLLPYREKSELLFRCLDNSEPIKIQEEALRQLSNYKDAGIGRRILGIWKDLGPHIRRYASDLLLYIESNHDALLTGLENKTINIGEMNFDLERRRTLLEWTDNKDTRRRAAALFSDTEISSRKDVIEQMKPALQLTGSAEKGALVFGSVCSSCHIHGTMGKDVGPTLNEINRKSKEAIMHGILDPNAAVDTRYISHRLETKTGIVHVGIVDIENDEYITIKKMGGEKVTVNRGDIKNFRSLGSSLMPEGLEGNLSHQQMADLLAYLQK